MAEHATQAVLGKGTLFERGNADGPPETFTTLHEVIAFTPPDEQADDVEVTHFESPSSTKEYIRGLIEGGTANFTVNYNPSAYATHNQIITDKAAGDSHTYRFVLPDSGETWTFTGYVKGVSVNTGPNVPQTLEVTLKVAGAVAVT